MCVFHGAVRKRCSQEGCTKKAVRVGLCNRHGNSSIRTIPQPTVRSKRSKKTKGMEEEVTRKRGDHGGNEGGDKDQGEEKGNEKHGVDYKSENKEEEKRKKLGDEEENRVEEEALKNPTLALDLASQTNDNLMGEGSVNTRVAP